MALSFCLSLDFAAAAETPPPSTVRATQSSDATELQRIRAEFQFEVGHAGYVAECHNLVFYVDEAPSGRDSSYGAVCTIAAGGVRKDWLMCNDTMVGTFTKTDHFEDSPTFVTNFIHDHCAPGG
ncbi:MAG: hypothetical protein JSR73_19350 [Proteobacteria bacterium]|nr:hypothetical protein [Pseudomonadota bacterium]